MPCLMPCKKSGVRTFSFRPSSALGGLSEASRQAKKASFENSQGGAGVSATSPAGCHAKSLGSENSVSGSCFNNLTMHVQETTCKLVCGKASQYRQQSFPYMFDNSQVSFHSHWPTNSAKLDIATRHGNLQPSYGALKQEPLANLQGGKGLSDVCGVAGCKHGLGEALSKVSE